VQGCKHTPKNFDLWKFRAKSQKIWAHSLNIQAKSRNILEKNAAQRCLTSKNGAQPLQKNYEDLFLLKVTQKKGFKIFVGENVLTKVYNVSGKLGEIRTKILRTPKNLLSTTLHLCFAE